jgi:hypothetical protein
LDEILENKTHLKKFMRLTRQCKAVLISRCCLIIMLLVSQHYYHTEQPQARKDLW